MKGKQTTYVSVSLSPLELAHLQRCVEASGKSRNRFLRDLIAAQQQSPNGKVKK